MEPGILGEWFILGMAHRIFKMSLEYFAGQKTKTKQKMEACQRNTGANLKFGTQQPKQEQFEPQNKLHHIGLPLTI